MSGIDVGDESRRLYEQVGALYAAVERLDDMTGADQQGDEDGTGVQILTDLLATVHEVARSARTPIGAALATAIRRYEADRTGA